MAEKEKYNLAPPLQTEAWLNTKKPLTLAQLKGKVVVIHAFQMLCPGCVAHGIPQASAIYKMYSKSDVQVIGLHTVFEHHDVMTTDALKVFIQEYRIEFPVAIDSPAEFGIRPKTMASYQMQGTPTLIILDKRGRVRLSHFGRMSDIQVGSFIGGLLEEKNHSLHSDEPINSGNQTDRRCGDEGCFI